MHILDLQARRFFFDATSPTGAGDAITFASNFYVANKADSEKRAYEAVDLYRAGADSVIAVSDTGVGMSQAALRRVFEPYFRADPLASEGSGLGLYIAKGIVEAHGGRIWAESEEGTGSSFHFTLPLSQGEAEDRGRRRRGPRSGLV